MNHLRGQLRVPHPYVTEGPNEIWRISKSEMQLWQWQDVPSQRTECTKLFDPIAASFWVLGRKGGEIPRPVQAVALPLSACSLADQDEETDPGAKLNALPDAASAVLGGRISQAIKVWPRIPLEQQRPMSQLRRCKCT